MSTPVRKNWTRWATAYLAQIETTALRRLVLLDYFVSITTFVNWTRTGLGHWTNWTSDWTTSLRYESGFGPYLSSPVSPVSPVKTGGPPRENRYVHTRRACERARTRGKP